MQLPIDESLIQQFERLLKDKPPLGRQKEQLVQDFLEQHTELIPTPNLLNHHLHFECVVSKFPLGTELTTDYVYITKSSAVWRITFVELENPDKPIFNADTRRVTTSAEFNAALSQVRSWNLYLQEHRDDVLRRLDPLLRPLNMRVNPIELHFQLIMGGSANKNLTPERKRHLHQIEKDSELQILTFDQLVSWYRNGHRFQKLVLRLTGTQFAFKYMHFEPTQILTFVGPDRLYLSEVERDRLRVAGYEIDKWSTGDLLTYNCRYATSTWDEAVKNGTVGSLLMLGKPTSAT